MGSEQAFPLLSLIAALWGLWFFGGHLREKISSQCTHDRRARRVSRGDNPRLFYFHVAQYGVLLVMLVVIAFISLVSVARMWLSG